MYAQRRIRSFVLRAGRVTAAQERALTDLWPTFGLDFRNEPIDLDVAFGRSISPGTAQRGVAFGRGSSPGTAEHGVDFGHGSAPGTAQRGVAFGQGSAPGTAQRGVAFGQGSAPGTALRCLEIGFGAGEVIGALAEANPDVDYLGIEVHRSGVGRLLLHANQAKLENVRVVCHDAVEVLKESIRDDSFDEILVFFPDPWHKKRHHKRRLIDPGFVALLADKMKSGATLRLATDWQEYAEQMLAVCTATPKLESLSPDGTYVVRPDFRPTTRFEKRGARLGHGVWDLAYRKRSI